MSLVRKFAVDPVWVLTVVSETTASYLEVNSFFDRRIHGALVCRPVLSPRENGSIGREGPSARDVFALFPFDSLSIRWFV